MASKKLIIGVVAVVVIVAVLAIAIGSGGGAGWLRTRCQTEL